MDMDEIPENAESCWRGPEWSRRKKIHNGRLALDVRYIFQNIYFEGGEVKLTAFKFVWAIWALNLTIAP